MTTEEIVRDQFKTYKISQMQLDPNGLCNAGCWFCPVAYKGNPVHAKKAMPVDLLKRIIGNIVYERDLDNGLVSKNFGGFYTSHYNETLLYPHLREFFETLREHRLVTMILSNGTTLTPNKVDLLKEYQDVLSGINLNVPVVSSRERWAKRTNMKEHLYDKLIRNIKYAMDELPDMVQRRSFSLGMNGINSLALLDGGGWIEKGPNFPDDIDLDPEKGENAMEVHVAKFLFPGLHVYGMPHLIDRAGLLDDVITNKEGIHKYLKASQENKKVVGCGNGIEVGGRPVGWIHINAIGQAFLCCNDYDMEIVVGDFKTQSLRDFWGNDNHVNKVVESYNTICRNCASARFE